MVIPNGVTTILDYAFDGCTSLVTVTIPSSVTTVWNKVFNGCSNLQTIIVKGKSQSDAEYLLRNANVPNGCQIIGEQEEPTIDPERDPAKTRVIYTEESGLPRTDRDIVGTLADSSIPNRTNAKEVYIGNTVTSIGYMALYDCLGLTIVTIPDSVTSIG